MSASKEDMPYYQTDMLGRTASSGYLLMSNSTTKAQALRGAKSLIQDPDASADLIFGYLASLATSTMFIRSFIGQCIIP